jgi:hypothetical protein
VRIDVDRDGERLNAELDALYPACLRDAAVDGAIFLPKLCDTPLPRYRRTAGKETFLYIEDPVRRWLAGTTSFNRVVGLDRRLDQHVRSPHSRFREPYQRMGLAKRIYLEALDAGLCLLSSARQSPGALQLWRSLGRHYPLHHVWLQDKRLVDLGRSIERRRFEDLHTRMLICGAGWSVERLLSLTPHSPTPSQDRSERQFPAGLRLKQQRFDMQSRRRPAGVHPGHGRAHAMTEQMPPHR